MDEIVCKLVAAACDLRKVASTDNTRQVTLAGVKADTAANRVLRETSEALRGLERARRSLKKVLASRHQDRLHTLAADGGTVEPGVDVRRAAEVRGLRFSIDAARRAAELFSEISISEEDFRAEVEAAGICGGEVERTTFRAIE